MWKTLKIQRLIGCIFVMPFLFIWPISPLFSSNIDSVFIPHEHGIENATAALPVPALLFPVSGEKLSFNRDESSYFIWGIDTIKFPGNEYVYDFLMVQVSPGQKPEEAIEKNQPFYSQNEIDNYYLSYPWNAPDMKDGDYAWRITVYKKSDYAVKINSLAQEFKIIQGGDTWQQKVELKYQNQYTELKEKLDASYQMAFDKKVYFKYEELYEISSTQKLRFKIYDEARNTPVYTDESGTVFPSGAAPAVVIHTGTQYLVVNLESAPGISTGKFYTLEIWNAKNERWFLRFFTAYAEPFIKAVIKKG